MTIRNLELEKEKVSLAEKEKIDFLRTASHELKTPVTELNATLENMILVSAFRFPQEKQRLLSFNTGTTLIL